MPGANDNATGAAAVLALARAFAGRNTARTIRFVEFVNEEPPFFQAESMGSQVYARECRRKGEKGQVPSEGGAVPALVPEAGFSDHWAFWKQGYPALMVTDTAFCRYAHYHLASDTPEKIDYDNLARVVAGLEHVTRGLAGGEEE